MSNTANRTDIESKKLNKPFQNLFKRMIDILISSIVLLLLSPLFIFLAILIVKEDGKPVFFKQNRSGKNDVSFSMYKFRSMKNKQISVPSNSHDIYNWQGGVPDNFIFKNSSEDNPNITRVGRVIRKYSLDELPQFFNVFKGNMSMVGPRPEILPISSLYNEVQKRRLEVKPGITGWAQTNGRSDINHGKKIEYDLYYVDNFSIWLDLKILFRTLLQVVLGKGSV